MNRSNSSNKLTLLDNHKLNKSKISPKTSPKASPKSSTSSNSNEFIDQSVKIQYYIKKFTLKIVDIINPAPYDVRILSCIINTIITDTYKLLLNKMNSFNTQKHIIKTFQRIRFDYDDIYIILGNMVNNINTNENFDNDIYQLFLTEKYSVTSTILRGTFITSINKNISQYSKLKCKSEYDSNLIVEEFMFKNNELLNIVFNIGLFIMSITSSQILNTFIILDTTDFSRGFISCDFQRLTFNKINDLHQIKSYNISYELVLLISTIIYDNHKYIYLTEDTDKYIIMIVNKIIQLELRTISEIRNLLSNHIEVLLKREIKIIKTILKRFNLGFILWKSSQNNFESVKLILNDDYIFKLTQLTNLRKC